jgi:tetratricopeptide (TPR) repeat protein
MAEPKMNFNCSFNMRIRNLIYVSLALAGCISSIVLAIESPVSSNPLGLGTVPPSAYQSGLIPSISPVSTSGNLVVTGDVAGGKYFRGIVPYRGVTDFGTSTSQISPGTVQVENFMRYSAGASPGQTGGLTPYYSPIWTVTKIPAGTGPAPQGGVVGSYAGTTGQQTGAQAQSVLQNEQAAYYNYNAMQLSRRPLSMSRQELQKVIDADITQYPMGGTPAIKNDPQGEFWKQMRIPVEQKPESTSPDKTGTGLTGVDSIKQLTMPTGSEPNVNAILNFGRENLAGLQVNRLLTGNQDNKPGTDVFEQMKLKLGRQPVEIPKLPKDANKQTDTQPSSGPASETNEPAETTDKAQIGAASSITEVYKSFAAYSNDKFNRYIKAGEDYVKKGRFYRAADSYTIAIVYKPKDPLGYAGKSLALFAAGEYLSSSLFLARALEIFPDYAKVKIDLVAMFGDKDLIEKRLIEAREWTERSKSGELAFLLSYIYCQMHRMEFARQSIEFAAQQMPDSKAVLAMKQAIDQRLKNQN